LDRAVLSLPPWAVAGGAVVIIIAGAVMLAVWARQSLLVPRFIVTGFLVSIAAAILGCSCFFTSRLTPWIERKQEELRQQFIHALRQFAWACKSYRSRPVWLGVAFLLGAVVATCNIAALTAFARALGVDASWSVFAVSQLVGIMAQAPPVAPNGMGLREPAIKELLVQTGTAGPPALAMTLLIDLQTIPFALVGCFCLLFERKRTTHDHKPARVSWEVGS
jgi:uncharacterized protein (TIRG00374 family)